MAQIIFRGRTPPDVSQSDCDGTIAPVSRCGGHTSRVSMCASECVTSDPRGPRADHQPSPVSLCSSAGAGAEDTSHAE